MPAPMIRPVGTVTWKTLRFTLPLISIKPTLVTSCPLPAVMLFCTLQMSTSSCLAHTLYQPCGGCCCCCCAEAVKSPAPRTPTTPAASTERRYALLVIWCTFLSKDPGTGFFVPCGPATCCRNEATG